MHHPYKSIFLQQVGGNRLSRDMTDIIVYKHPLSVVVVLANLTRRTREQITDYLSFKVIVSGSIFTVT